MPKRDILNLAFGLAYIGVILSWVLRAEPYERPIIHFIFISIAIAILAIQIVLATQGKRQIVFTFAKIALMVLTIQWSQLLIYPSVIGTDPLYHHTLIYNISHHIELGKWDYFSTMLFHQIIGNFSAFTGLSEKWATMISIGLPYTLLTTWTIYKLGSLIHSYKTGLMAALVLNMASMFLFFGIEIIPSTLAMGLGLVSVYLLISCVRNKKTNVFKYLLLALVLLMVMYSHSLVAVFVMITIGLLWIGLLIFNYKVYKLNIRYHRFIIVAIVFAVVNLLWWALYSNQIVVGLRMFKTELISDYFGTMLPDMRYWQGSLSAAVASGSTSDINYEILSNLINQYQNGVPFIEIVIKRIGLFIYALFGIWGTFVLFWKYRVRPWAFTLGFTVLILGISCVVNGILSRYFFISRHIFLVQILLAPMVGIGILTLSDYVKRYWAKYVVVGISIFVLSFITIISPYTNIDNRTFAPNSVGRQAFTQGELSGIDDICKTWKGTVASDWYVGYYIYHERKVNDSWVNIGSLDISDDFVIGNFDNLPPSTLILVRNEVKEYPVLVLDRFYKLPQDVDVTLVQDGFKCVYNNGVVRGYMR